MVAPGANSRGGIRRCLFACLFSFAGEWLTRVCASGLRPITAAVWLMCHRKVPGWSSCSASNMNPSTHLNIFAAYADESSHSVAKQLPSPPSFFSVIVACRSIDLFSQQASHFATATAETADIIPRRLLHNPSTAHVAKEQYKATLALPDHQRKLAWHSKAGNWGELALVL